MYQYKSVVEALKDLKARGYTIDLNLAFDKLICEDKNICLNPGDFEITEVYRYEGQSNPDDESIVYGISSKDGEIKGVLVSAFGLYADPMSDEMIKKMQVNA